MLARMLRTLRLGFKSLFLHKLRSSLAMLGILIGVTAVIWLVALGEGISYQAQKQIQELGARNVIIKSVKPPASSSSGGGGFNFVVYGLKVDDFDRIETIPTVERSVPMREISREFRHDSQLINGQFIGCTPAYLEINHLELDRGEFLTDSHNSNRKSVCVLGWEMAEKLFPLQDPIGQNVQADLDFYKVIGVTKESSFSSVFPCLLWSDFPTQQTFEWETSNTCKHIWTHFLNKNNSVNIRHVYYHYIDNSLLISKFNNIYVNNTFMSL